MRTPASLFCLRRRCDVYDASCLLDKSMNRAVREDLMFSIIIVNYNTGDLLSACLDSLQGQQALIREVVVVDNNSQDNSVDRIRKAFPAVRVIGLPENIGFGRANNRALDSCSGDLFFLLNPDTRLQPGCMAAMAAYMAANRDVGMAGTAVYDAQGIRQATANLEYPGNHYSGALFSGLPGDIAWLLGASLVIRRQVMEQVQGFDPDYFLYGEDIDLSLRVRQAGWRLGYIPDAGIIHLEGQSERTTPPAQLFEKKMQGELLFYTKHYPADTVRRIKRVRRVQAVWRLASLWIQKIFGREDEVLRQKRAKYTVAARLYR